jgi:hypothetical protein
VSIAVQSVYPGKQEALLCSDVLQEAQKLVGNVLPRALGSVGHEQQVHYPYEGRM